jgi:O-antigen/teichoic acid export membrane protein
LETLKSKGIAAFVWDFLGKISTQGMSFFVTIILARLLEPSDFGLIAILLIITGAAQVLTDVGLGAALIQKSKVLSIHYSSVFYINLLLASLFTSAVYFGAGYFADIYSEDELQPLIKTISFIFIIKALTTVQIIRLKKELNYALLSKISFLSSLLSGVLGIYLALNDYGVWSIIFQIITQGLLFNIILWYSSSWLPKLEFSLTALLELWTFGFRMFITGLIEVIFSRIDFLILAKLVPMSTLGYYHRAKSFNELIVSYTSSSLMAVLFPLLSQIKNDLYRYQKLIEKILGILSFSVFLLLGGLYINAEDFIVFLFTDKWLESVVFMKIILLSAFGYPISALLKNVLSTRGNSKHYLELEIVKRVFHLLNLANLYFNGVYAYLYGLIIISFLCLFFDIYYVKKEIFLGFKELLLPIFLQMLLCVLSITITVFSLPIFELNSLMSFIMRTLLFLSIFIGSNAFFKISSFEYTWQEISSVLSTIKGKFTKLIY